MIYQQNRNYIINNTMEQLLPFVTGGAGVGSSKSGNEMKPETEGNETGESKYS